MTRAAAREAEAGRMVHLLLQPGRCAEPGWGRLGRVHCDSQHGGPAAFGDTDGGAGADAQQAAERVWVAPHAGRCYIEAFLLEVPRRFAKQGMTILNTKSEIRIKIHGKTVHMKWSILAARAPDYFCVALSEKNGRDGAEQVRELGPNGSEDKTALAARLSDLRVFVGHVNAISAPG